MPLTTAQQTAVLKAIEAAKRRLGAHEAPLPDGAKAYAWRNTREQIRWGVIDVDGDHIARGELEPGETL
jgi:hypothetical protein